MLSPSRLRSSFSSCLLLTAFASALNLDCSDIREDNQSWNFQSLGGQHSVKSLVAHPPTDIETTFTVDICKALKVPKGLPKDEYCPNGTRVCGIERSINAIENITSIIGAIGIAGEYGTSTGESLNPKLTRLKTSPSPTDREKEGLRLLMHGAKYPPDKDGLKQQVVIDFLCDRKQQDRRRENSGKTTREEDGEEGSGEGGGEDEKDPNSADGQETDDGEGGKLKYLSYNDVQGTKVLSLEWTTKYACEDSSKEGRSSSSGHWGFFTWLVIIVFLGTATYLIFGSWLNYTRHGVKGFDAVPHSEAIRDIPYLLRDWSRKIVNTVSGGGSRGGYSAV